MCSRTWDRGGNWRIRAGETVGRRVRGKNGKLEREEEKETGEDEGRRRKRKNSLLVQHNNTASGDLNSHSWDLY